MPRYTKKPVLVTGATGFIASHIIKQLLDQGYKVRGTVRSLENRDKNHFLYRLSPNKNANLQLVEADLLKPETWGPAVEGCDFVIHVASPFPLQAPKDEDELIKPAVEGTLNVLKAATEKRVKRVVVTSSVAAVMYGHEDKVCTPEDWSDVEKCGPYAKSKTLAEKAAWQYWEENSKPFDLATVLPSFVVGRLFTESEGTSEKIIREIMIGKMEALPHISFGTVDVRNVAEAHIKALFSPNSNGKRYIASSETFWLKDIAETLETTFSRFGYDVTTDTVANWKLKMASWFNNDQAKAIIGELDIERKFDNKKTSEDLGLKFRDTRESIKEMGYSLINVGAVPNLIKMQENKYF